MNCSRCSSTPPPTAMINSPRRTTWKSKSRRPPFWSTTANPNRRKSPLNSGKRSHRIRRRPVTVTPPCLRPLHRRHPPSPRLNRRRRAATIARAASERRSPRSRTPTVIPPKMKAITENLSTWTMPPMCYHCRTCHLRPTIQRPPLRHKPPKNNRYHHRSCKTTNHSRIRSSPPSTASTGPMRTVTRIRTVRSD